MIFARIQTDTDDMVFVVPLVVLLEIELSKRLLDNEIREHDYALTV